jgi:multiple antibiotic resistance protein
MLASWLTLIGATFAALLPIANPFSTAPVFLAVTSNMMPDERMDQARRACIYTFFTLAVTLGAGALILAFFGISLQALRIAGGLIVANIGFGMLNPKPKTEDPQEKHASSMAKHDVAFTPIAMPMLSGPGSIAVTVGMATEADTPLENLAIVVGIALVCLVSWIVLRSSTRVVEYLGATGVDVLSRIMGLLLVCIGIQFIFRGLEEFIASPEFMGAMLNAIRAASGS